MVKAILNQDNRYIQLTSEFNKGFKDQRVDVLATILEPKFEELQIIEGYSIFYVIIFEGKSSSPYLINEASLDFESSPSILPVLDKRG
jgi:hypothetical protein